ncbi:MAG: hypothetical protein GY913_26280 [Proteobacteria bacterium]|nr:hypothetical protein [Pseudomonadota bacterium]MCP4920425.1 hypothetical protein [Pseudomonadota bacterium]
MTRLPILLLALGALVACNTDTDDDGTPDALDCSDENADIHADAEEICDGIDNNCDGVVDEGVTTTFYADADGDGYGGTVTIEACEAPAGFLEDSTDCNDLDASANPAGVEVCDDVDNDCDGAVDADDDDVDASTGGTYYVDGDGDGYGDPQQTVEACGTPDGHADNGDDCNDTDADVSPETIWYSDVDGDGYGAETFTEASCEQPSGYTADATDCDDLDAAINPAADEVCDLADNDCDGLTDDDDDSVDVSGYVTYYADGDADGYGLDDTTVIQCNAPSGYADLAGDCDDSLEDVNPGEVEVCADGLDNDCSGDAPECGIAAGSYTSTDADYTLTGDNSSDYMGRSVATADLDGDGTDELIGGAYGNDDNGSGAGQVAVWYGVTSSGSAADTADALISGESSSSSLGYAVANAGDIDGDGTDDLLLGAYAKGSYAGSAYLVYGSASALTDASVGDVGVEYFGAGTSDYLGYGVAGLGDINDDGFADFALGAYGDDDNGSYSGSVWIHYGSASALSGGGTGSADAQLYGGGSSGYVGFYTSFDGVGDIDGDGIDDAAFGSYYNANSYYGGVYLYYGSTSAMSGSAAVATNADASFSGSGIYDYFGRTVTGGDLTGDGYSDLIAWEYYGGSDTGAVFVFEGSTSVSGSYSASSDATYTWTGGASYDYFGRSLAVADINGDGDDDLIVGAGGEDTGGSTAGATYIIYGPMTTGGDHSTTDVQIYGDNTSEYLGYYGVAGGDLDGDGADDVIGGAYGATSSTGELLVFMGGGQ